MQFGILITNNGTHSAEKWASAVASKIITLSPDISEDHLIAAQRFQATVAEVLVSHHQDAKDEVVNSLKADSAAHFTAGDLHNPGERLNVCIDEIVKASVGTPWENEFKNQEILNGLSAYIGQSLVDLKHVERLTHADNNPNDELAKAYKTLPSGILTIPAAELSN
jgi:hypothetical protein